MNETYTHSFVFPVLEQAHLLSKLFIVATQVIETGQADIYFEPWNARLDAGLVRIRDRHQRLLVSMQALLSELMTPMSPVHQLEETTLLETVHTAIDAQRLAPLDHGVHDDESLRLYALSYLLANLDHAFEPLEDE